MRSHEGKLIAAVLAAQELTPQILRRVIYAHHGPKLDRPAQLRIAIAKTRELLTNLETCEIAVGWRNKDDAA